jgi:hypothetical protein
MRGESHFFNHVIFAASFLYRAASLSTVFPQNVVISGLGHVEVGRIAHAQFHNYPSDSEPVTSLSCCRIWTMNDNRAVM